MSVSETGNFETVCVVGLGYIGLPTAAILASRGLKVVGVDIDSRAVDTINRGEIHIVEPDLDIIVRAVVASGNLRATMTPEPADAFLVAVPTPFSDGHKPDISHIDAAARSIAPALRRGSLVILESTSPVGTTEQLSQWLSASRSDLTFPHQEGERADVQVAYCPERVLPGRIVNELVHNDRVIGGITARCAERAAALYRTFVDGECILTDSRTAEMCKLTENAFRDVNIAFANELSVICDVLKLDVWQLIELANRHPRVSILQPGPGVGGHCIAVDPWFIVSAAPEQARLIKIAREVNDSKPQQIVDAVVSAVSGMHDPVIACLGLSYKADIDDLRESPAVEIVGGLARRKLGTVLAVEPHITALPEKLRKAGARLSSLDQALSSSGVIVVLVNHSAFAGLRARIGKDVITVDATGLLRERRRA
jgi:UDP-N-acetyl-D-mannosaminuronic acid dehydrogenase